MRLSKHAVVIGMAVVALVGAAAVFAIILTSDDEQAPTSAQAGIQATEVPSPAPSTVVPISTPPLPTVTPAPAASAPAPAPPSVPEPAPPAAPVIRTCEEIRADPEYRSEEERQFFLANCQVAAPPPRAETAPAPQPAPAGPAAPSAPPAPAVPCSQQSSYVSRGSAAAGSFTAQAAQYLGTPSMGAQNDLLQLGAITLNFANDLRGLEPVPDSCRAVHDQLVSSLLAVYDLIREVERIRTLAEFTAWVARYDRAVDTLLVAFDNWLAATGIQLPNLGGLR